jgi:serine/threonine protein kinase
VRKAVEIAIAIARGLGAAHGKGIAHRDLKPANVFLLADGQVKLLDFGLARATGPATAVGDTTTQSALTDPGTVLGTAGYMAPEQVRGQHVYGRADLFALGVVLYEMLTGQRAFARDSTVETLNAILKEDPAELSATRADLPPALDRIVRHCLEKTPAHRFQSAQDVVFALEGLSGSAPVARQPDAAVRWRSSRWASAATWSVAGAVAAVAALLALSPGALDSSGPRLGGDVLSLSPRRIASSPRTRIQPSRRMARESPSGRPMTSAPSRSGCASSPAVRRGPSRGARCPLVISNGSTSAPTGGRSSSRAAANSIVRKSTEERQRRCTRPSSVLASSGVILFASVWGDTLRMIPAVGGEPQPVTISSGDGVDLGPAYPRFLPDGRHFLFLSTRHQQIFVGDLESRTAHRLVDTASPVEFASGHLLYAQNGLLMAQPFDPQTRTTRGDPRQLVSGVGINPASIFEASFSSSANGRLVFWEGFAAPRSQLVWIDRDGRRRDAVGPVGHYHGFALAPRTRRAAIERFVLDPKVNRIEVIVLDASGTAPPVRLGSNNEPKLAATPVWTPDETQVYVTGFPGIYRLDAATGAGAIANGATGSLQDRSPDGATLGYEWSSAGTNDLFLVRPGDASPTPFRQTRFYESEIRIAPNGRHAAWVADDTGTFEVYLSGFPEVGRVTRVSGEGGRQPMWRADGRELYFLSHTNELMAVEVRTNGDAVTVSRRERCSPRRHRAVSSIDASMRRATMANASCSTRGSTTRCRVKSR